MVEYRLFDPPWSGELNCGCPADDGETTDPWGLVGDWNPDCGVNPLGGELPHLSMCSGFTDVWMGLDGGS